MRILATMMILCVPISLAVALTIGLSRNSHHAHDAQSVESLLARTEKIARENPPSLWEMIEDARVRAASFEQLLDPTPAQGVSTSAASSDAADVPWVCWARTIRETGTGLSIKIWADGRSEAHASYAELPQNCSMIAGWEQSGPSSFVHHSPLRPTDACRMYRAVQKAGLDKITTVPEQGPDQTVTVGIAPDNQQPSGPLKVVTETISVSTPEREVTWDGEQREGAQENIERFEKIGAIMTDFDHSPICVMPTAGKLRWQALGRPDLGSRLK